MIVVSILLNYSIGRKLVQSRSLGLLRVGIILNLCLLISTKYFSLLLIPIIEVFLPRFNQIPNESIWFPIGVSFFTFTQIGFLVDVYRKATRLCGLTDYSNFVVFFPHLIAGPVLNYAAFVPQLTSLDLPVAKKLRNQNLRIGFAIFVNGMAKKVLIADRLAPMVAAYFDNNASSDNQKTFVLLVILAYSAQIYFDFSGYSEMAFGLARMMGLQIPLNFKTPYQSKNIIDFWRRWHISLSSFLRDYLYIPLGGSHKSKLQRYRNLAITMVLGGLWHGANWTFAIWGLLHGILLGINHLIQDFHAKHFEKPGSKIGKVPQLVLDGSKVFVTFSLVSLLWVFFRSPNLEIAFKTFGVLFNFPNGLETLQLSYLGILFIAYIWVFLERNLDERFSHQSSEMTTARTLLTFVFTFFLLSTPSAFLYAQF